MKNNYKVVAPGKECRKCGKIMERRVHKVINDKLLKQYLYYSEWDFCGSCNMVQFYDEFQVLSPTYADYLERKYYEGHFYSI